MSLMPAGIILYLQLTSPGFLEVLYGNPFRRIAITVCLGILWTFLLAGAKNCGY